MRRLNVGRLLSPDQRQRNIPSSKVTGVPQTGRFTNLQQLSVDTSWWVRYRSTTNPDLGFECWAASGKAPGELKAKIQASLRRESRPKLEWFSRVSLPLAYAAAFLFVSIAVPWTWRTFSLAKDQALVAQAISNHVRSLIAAHLADVYSSDEHTVKAWFTGKLDYSPQVVDLAERGFPLIGGRIDMVDQRPVAAIVYQHKNHLINLFVWPVASRKIDLEVQSDGDYRFCGWNNAGLNYLCISEGSAIALEEFEDEVREHTNL
jgi:anti-sigma factor RsiW